MGNPSVREYIEQARTEAQKTAEELDQQTQGFAGMIYRSTKNFIDNGGTREAAALSYYAVFSLFPLMLLLIFFIGLIIGPAATQNQLEDFLRFFLPGDTATDLNRTISRFVEQGNTASIVALSGLSWSALGLFSNLEAALSRTFRDTSQRPWLRRRANGCLMIMALGVLLTANILTSLIFSFLGLLFLDSGSIWLSIAGTFVPFGFSMGIFAMLYRWIPKNRVSWDAIWPAALLAAFVWEIAKRLFSIYLEVVTDYNLVYGSIATIIIFMLWVFVTFTILLFFAEFCVLLQDWLLKRRESKPERHDFALNYYEKRLELPSNDPDH